MTEEVFEPQPISGKGVDRMAKVAQNYADYLQTKMKSQTHVEELGVRRATLKNRGVHSSWWDTKGMRTAWFEVLLFHKEKYTEKHKAIVDDMDLTKPMDDPGNVRQLIKLQHEAKEKGAIRSGAAAPPTWVDIFGRGFFDTFTQPFGGAFSSPKPEAAKVPRVDIDATKNQNEIDRQRKLKSEKKEEETRRKQQEKEVATEKRRKEEREAKITEARERARKEAEKVAGVFYTKEGREKSSQLMDDLVDVSKGRTSRKKRVREQVLHQVDRLTDPFSSGIIRGMLGNKLVGRWLKANPTRGSEYAERNKRRKVHFDDLTKQYRTIAQARAHIKEGKPGIQIPRHNGVVRSIYKDTYCDEFEATFEKLKNDFGEDNNPPWFIPTGK